MITFIHNMCSFVNVWQQRVRKSESIHLKLSIANEKGMLGMCYYGL